MGFSTKVFGTGNIRKRIKAFLVGSPSPQRNISSYTILDKMFGVSKERR